MDNKSVLPLPRLTFYPECNSADSRLTITPSQTAEVCCHHLVHHDSIKSPFASNSLSALRTLFHLPESVLFSPRDAFIRPHHLHPYLPVLSRRACPETCIYSVVGNLTPRIHLLNLSTNAPRYEVTLTPRMRIRHFIRCQCRVYT